MDTINCIFRKITKDEFDRLHNLFPDSEQMWLKFRDIRWKEFDPSDYTLYLRKTTESCFYYRENRNCVKCVYKSGISSSWLCPESYEYVDG